MNILSRSKAIFKKDLLIAMSYKGSFVMEFLSSLFSLLIVFFISDFIDSQSNNLNKELSKGYFHFVFWGLVTQDLMLKIVGASSRDLLNYKTSGILEELIQIPSAQLTVILGSNLYPIFMSFIRLILSLLVASFLIGEAFIKFDDIFYFMSNLILLIVSFISVGLIATSYALFFFKTGPIPIFFISFSVIFGSTYFPVELLPSFLNNLSIVTPLSPALENFRMLSSNDFDVIAFFLNLSKILVLNLIFITIALLSLKASFEYAQKNGTFLHY